MKIGIYNPYFDSFGGGERYMLTAAEHWSKSHSVSVFWDDPSMLSESELRFALDLSRVKQVPNVFKRGMLINKLLVSATYDLIFFLSDGSVPLTLAQYNILNFQVPFSHIAMTPWKRARYQSVVCYSNFTRDLIDKTLGIPISVISPPVDVEKIKPGKKEHIILSVGRFNGLYEVKKHDVLIEAFKKNYKNKKLNGWKFILAGGLLESDRNYFETLRASAKGFPIEFYPNCSFKELKKLYATASLYWHAAGFGETNPEHMEHFGITTVEAMAAGCVPIVFAGGGQPEIIHDAVDGLLWTTTDELICKTITLIYNPSIYARMKKASMKRSEDFSKKQFTDSIDGLLKNICKQTS